MTLSRRLVLAGSAAGLTGCGFHPVYGPLAKGGGTVRPELAAIFVAVMPERSGQLLRQALQRRLEGTDASVSKRYELTGGMNVAAEGIGIQQDSSSTRVRINASIGWTLIELGVTPKPLFTGSARATDGYDVNNQQYFAADLETSAVIARLAETLADQVALDLAIYFRRRAEAA